MYVWCVCSRCCGQSLIVWPMTSALPRSFCRADSHVRHNENTHLSPPSSLPWQGNSFAMPSATSLAASDGGSGGRAVPLQAYYLLCTYYVLTQAPHRFPPLVHGRESRLHMQHPPRPHVLAHTHSTTTYLQEHANPHKSLSNALPSHTP